MKKVFFHLVLILTISATLVSCGTISGKMSKVTLVDAPKNLVAKADGETVDIKSEMTLSQMSIDNSRVTEYYAPVVKLNKRKKISLELSSGGTNGTAELTPKFSGAYFLGNMFTSGIILGTAIDMATASHRKHVRFVDVPAVLAGKPKSEWRGKHQLKRAIKKSAKR